MNEAEQTGADVLRGGQLHGIRSTRRFDENNNNQQYRLENNNPQPQPQGRLQPQPPVQSYAQAQPPPTNQVQADNKSNAPRQSYMYNVPQLDPKKMNELKKFLIQQKADNPKQKQVSNWRKFSRQFGSMSLNTWYFLGMLFFEVFIAMVYILGLVVTDATSKRIGLGVLIIVTSILYGLWIINLVWKKDLVDRYWGWVWLGFCFDALGAGIAGAANAWYVSMIFSIIQCLYLSWVLSGLRKNCWSTLLIVALCFVLILGGFQLAFVVQSTNNITFILSIEYLVIFALALLGIAYHLGCKQRWGLKTKHEKWQFICIFYLMSIDLGFGLAIGIQGHLMWVWLTQIINATFFFSFVYFLVVILQIKCGKTKFNIWQKIKKCWKKQQEANPNIMYQMADVLLTTDREYLNNPRKSVIGKPLAECTLCMNQQSRFCYENCRHVCVGHECILDWLKRGMKKCPLCRETSDVMLEVKRLRDLEFQIQNRYRIGLK